MESNRGERTKLSHSKPKFSAGIPKVNNRWRHICPLHQSELCSGDTIRNKTSFTPSNGGELEPRWCWGQTNGSGWQPEYPCSCPGPPPITLRYAWHEEQLGPYWGNRGPGRPSFKCCSNIGWARTLQGHVPIVCKFLCPSIC